MRRKSFLPVALGITLTFMLARLPLVALGGTIRHDRSDQLYRAGSKDPALAAVVQLLVDGSPSCSGTLIAPQWVLTATHCIWPTATVLFPRQTIVINGQRIDIGPENIYINPEWLAGGFDVLSTRGDIALIRLPRPVERVRPIPVHQQADEVGQEAFFVGFGSTGTGLTGNTIRTAVKRMGSNVVDATAATITFPVQYPYSRSVTVGSPRALLSDFDDPRRSASTLGSDVPLNREYTTAQGDSGGPLLLFRNRGWTVAGITSGGIDGFYGTSSAASFYSDTATFTRVRSYRSWIDSVMKGNAPNLIQYFAQFGDDSEEAMRTAMRKHRERQTALREKGWRLQMRAATLRNPAALFRTEVPGVPSRPQMMALVDDMLAGFAARINSAVPVDGGDAEPDATVVLEDCRCHQTVP